MRVEKTLIQTLACQLSCNFCSRLTRTWELRKLLYKSSLANSNQLLCNSCSDLTRTWVLRKLSSKLSLVNYHLLSSNSCSQPGHKGWENSYTNSRLSAGSHQLSCNSCSHLNRTRKLRKLLYNPCISQLDENSDACMTKSLKS